MKRALLALCILVLAPVVALADPVVIVLDSDRGMFYDGEGKAFYVRLVTPEGSPPPVPPVPQPPDPDDPQPPAPVDLQTKVQRWAEEIDDPGTAAALALVYRTIGQQITTGLVKPTRPSLQTALRSVTQTLDLLESVNPDLKRSQWDTFLDKLASEINAALSDGMDAAEGAKLFSDVSAGLSASHAGQALPDWLQPILQLLVQLVIQWLTQWLGGASHQEAMNAVDIGNSIAALQVEADRIKRELFQLRHR